MVLEVKIVLSLRGKRERMVFRMEREGGVLQGCWQSSIPGYGYQWW